MVSEQKTELLLSTLTSPTCPMMPMLYVRFGPLLWNQWNILRDTWSQCTKVLVFTVLNVERSVYLKFFWMKTYRIYFHVIRQKNLDSSHVIWLGNKWQWHCLYRSWLKLPDFPPFSRIVQESAFYIEVHKLSDTLHTISTGLERKYVLDKQLLSILDAVFIDDYWQTVQRVHNTS